MQRIANPLKQRGMELAGMQWIANPLKQRGMKLVEMQRIANPLKQREMELGDAADCKSAETAGDERDVLSGRRQKRITATTM